MATSNSAPYPEADHETTPLLPPPASSATNNHLPAADPSPNLPNSDPPEYYAPPASNARRVRFSTPPPSPPPASDPENTSVLPSYSAAKYGNYTSEADYLAALRAWAEEKAFIEPGDTGLVGFYGKTTMEGYIQRPGGGMRSRRKEKVDRKKEEGKGAGDVESKERRRSSISQWLARKRQGSNGQ
ncbi:MAG: hypothetical protein Q9195_004089 [Heterodermia aff. obscurata]